MDTVSGCCEESVGPFVNGAVKQRGTSIGWSKSLGRLKNDLIINKNRLNESSDKFNLLQLLFSKQKNRSLERSMTCTEKLIHWDVPGESSSSWHTCGTDLNGFRLEDASLEK